MTPWTVAHQAPPSVGFFQGTILEWVVISFTRVSFRPRDQTWVSQIAGRPFTVWTTRERLRADFHPSWDLKGWALFHTLLPCSGASISWRETFYPPQFLCLAYSIIIHLMTIGSVVISHFICLHFHLFCLHWRVPDWKDRSRSLLTPQGWEKKVARPHPSWEADWHLITASWGFKFRLSRCSLLTSFMGPTWWAERVQGSLLLSRG